MEYPAIREGSITFRAYNELPLSATLCEQWDRLLDTTDCNRAFSSACWFRSACKANPALAPFVVTAWRGHELAGVLPLVQVSGATAVEFPPFFSDYNDIIARPQDQNVIEGLLEYSTSMGVELTLKNLRFDSNCYRAIAHVSPELVGELFQIERSCLYISLDSGYDEYLASRSGNFRAQLARIERKAQQAGLNVRTPRPEEFSPELLPEVFLSIHLERFREKSAFWEEGGQAFVRTAFPELFRQGRLKPFLLMAGERVIAITICMAGATGLCLWNGGFLPEAEEYSPGRLLLAEQLRQSFALGMKEYDMLRGAHSYKARWATGSRSIGRFELAPGLALFSQRCAVGGSYD